MDNAMLDTAKVWTRLTPADVPTEIMVARYRHQENGLHTLKAGVTEFSLSNAEALAFARQLPEVRALVAVLRVLWEQSATTDELGRGYDVHIHGAFAGEIVKALRPFEEAADA